MNRKRKIGILLVLIGVGIPSVLYFFQDDGVIFEIRKSKVGERKLNDAEIASLKAKKMELKETIVEDWSYDKLLVQSSKYSEVEPKSGVDESFGVDRFDKEIWTITTFKTIAIPFRQVIGIGILITFIGFGMFIFSFFPKDKPRKAEMED